MKFGKYWKDAINGLPQWYQSKSISYKEWKKLSKKTQDTKHLFSKFRLDIKKVDNAFEYLANRGWSVFDCCLPSVLADDNLEKNTIAFAHINATAVRKLCKKLDKQHGCYMFSKWLSDCKDRHQYAFLGGMSLTVLEIKNHTNPKLECPVCWECTNSNVVMHCGHVVCLDCTKCILGCKSARQHWEIMSAKNRNASRVSCPVCRHPFAYYGMTII